MKPFLIGTRGSALALAQCGQLRDRLASLVPERTFELAIIRTRGDDLSAAREQGAPAPASLEKGLFTKEIEEALLAGRIDAAVHSLKDMPVDDVPGLTVGAIPERADCRDVLVLRGGDEGGLDTVPKGSVIATGSPRRVALLLHLRPDLKVIPLRGNIDTRLRKLRENAEWAGIVLAAAGLERLKPELNGLHVVPLPPDLFLPAPGQGALAFQIRVDDGAALEIAAKLDDAPTRAAVTAERAFLAALGGGCRAPVGAYGRKEGDRLHLDGIVWVTEGLPARSGFLEGDEAEAEALGRALGKELLEAKE